MSLIIQKERTTVEWTWWRHPNTYNKEFVPPQVSEMRPPSTKGATRARIIWRCGRARRLVHNSWECLGLYQVSKGWWFWLFAMLGDQPFNTRTGHCGGRHSFNHNSPVTAAREVFKHSPPMDSASLVIPRQKKFNFGFGVLLGGHHKWGCFSVFVAYFTRPWTPMEWAHILAQTFLQN